MTVIDDVINDLTDALETMIRLHALETMHHQLTTRKAEHGCTNQSCALCDNDFPGEEDGPWAEGWFRRSSTTPLQYVRGLQVDHGL